MKKGDIVEFVIGNNPIQFEVLTDEYEMLGEKVVDLKDYPGEVSVKYLKKVTS